MVFRIHPTVVLDSPWDGEVDIDEEIAEWVEDLWNSGVRTYYTCQGMAIPRQRRPRIDGGTPYRLPDDEPGVIHYSATYGYIVYEPDGKPAVRQSLARRGWTIYRDEGPKQLLRHDHPTLCIRFQRWVSADVPALR